MKLYEAHVRAVADKQGGERDDYLNKMIEIWSDTLALEGDPDAFRAGAMTAALESGVGKMPLTEDEKKTIVEEVREKAAILKRSNRN